MFREGHLTLGLFFAIESYVTDMPTMTGQVELARKAEADGFAALWTRDVPLRDPTFGEVGQIFRSMGLARLRDRAYQHDRARDRRHRPTDHPLHVAKASASVHNLSQRRLVLGGLRRPANRVSRVRSRYRSAG
jgi:alkanesulfonate monooxygenase SsuD/methylene tetrahydromethanopterin reductase-like flavin-dependent oxidoreductase (luciferase family)